MKPLSACRLYTFIDTAYLRGRPPELVAEHLCAGGSDLVQLRAKQSSIAEIRAMAGKILPITSRANVSLIINDHPSIALDLSTINHLSSEVLLTKEDPLSTFLGCHLGQEDFFDAGHTHVSELKTNPGSAGVSPAAFPSTINHPLSTILGLSSHSRSQALRAVQAGADYIAIGPVYATGTKPSAKPVTLEYVRWAAQNIKIPWFAIGGINLQNLDDVLAAGAQRICVVSAILNSDDITAECKKFKLRLS